MTDQEARFYNIMTCFLARLPAWFIVGKTLGEFLTNRAMKLPVYVMVDCHEAVFERSCVCSNVPILEKKPGCYVVGIADQSMTCVFLKDSPKMDRKLVFASQQTVADSVKSRRYMTPNGLWRVNIDEQHPYYVQLPYQYGAVMDLYHQGWWKECSHNQRPWNGPVFFDEQHKKNGSELLRMIFECGKRVGIQDAMWLGFGCCLGAVRNGGFIPADNDLDICIDSDKISRDQEEAYLAEIAKPFELDGKRYEHGLCEKRFQAPSRRGPGGRALWTSIGHKSIQFEAGVKACHWFFFEHQGIAWHSKGGRWVTDAKFSHNQFQYKDTDQAICLGMPASLLKDFVSVEFEGVQVRMPLLAGMCCDWWYPGWADEHGGSSARKIVMAVGKWDDPRTWRTSAP